MPLIGATESNILYDYTLGLSTKFDPFKNFCWTKDFYAQADLKTILENAFSPLSENTTFLGEDKTPWDTSQTFWHFTHLDEFEAYTEKIETFWEIKSGELKWARMNSSPRIYHIKNGLEAASFTDDDFKLPGCTQKVYDDLAASKAQPRG